MTWTSYAEQKRGNVNMGIKEDEITMRLQTPKQGKPRLIFRIGQSILAKGKMNFGDVVDLLISDDKAKGLIKKADKGWKLRDSRKAAELNMPWGESAPFAVNNKKLGKLDYQLSNGGITFNVPQE